AQLVRGRPRRHPDTATLRSIPTESIGVTHAKRPRPGIRPIAERFRLREQLAVQSDPTVQAWQRGDAQHRRCRQWLVRLDVLHRRGPAPCWAETARRYVTARG